MFSCCQCDHSSTVLTESVLADLAASRNPTDDDAHLSPPGSLPSKMTTDSASLIELEPNQRNVTATGANTSVRSDMSDTTAMSLTPAEELKEKTDLEEMVKRFTKGAQQGQPCTLLDPNYIVTGPAIYTIDMSSRTFSVSLGETTISLALLTIQDVITENAQVVPPFKISTQDPCCFVCVRYLENGEAKNLGMLLPTPTERGRFYASMTILTWAMRQERGKA